VAMQKGCIVNRKKFDFKIEKPKNAIKSIVNERKLLKK
jgi:hypothetical protein